MKRIPFVIAMIILAAHFLRYGALPLVLICLLMPFLLLIKKPWVITITSLYAYFGGIIWLFVTSDLYMERQAYNEPWMRMVLILGTVSIFTFAAGMLLRTPTMRMLYNSSQGVEAAPEESSLPD